MSTGVWFQYQIWDRVTDVIVYESTNDNEDTGYPGEYASWSSEFDTVQEALKHTGVSRTGCMGSKVTVFLDGEKI